MAKRIEKIYAWLFAVVPHISGCATHLGQTLTWQHTNWLV